MRAADVTFKDSLDFNPAMDELAACRSADPDLFFPESAHDYEKAVTICRSCPIQQKCLEWAVRTKASGVWGGTLLKSGVNSHTSTPWRRELAKRKALRQTCRAA